MKTILFALFVALIASQKTETFGTKDKAKFQLTIQKCCCWGGVASDVAKIRRECVNKYGTDIYFVINSDKEYTGALEAELSPIGKPDQGIFVH